MKETCLGGKRINEAFVSRVGAGTRGSAVQELKR